MSQMSLMESNLLQISPNDYWMEPDPEPEPEVVQ